MKTINFFMSLFVAIFVFLALNNTSFGQYWATDGTHIWNTNSGHVGIGTTMPLAKLTVENTGLTPAPFGAWFTADWPGFDDRGNIYFMKRGTGGWETFRYMDVRWNSLPVFMVRGDGRVGIGVDNPDITLDVVGKNPGNAGIEVQNTSTDPSASAVIRILDPTGNSKLAMGVDETGKADLFIDGLVKAPYFGHFQFLAPVKMEEALYLNDSDVSQIGGPLDLNIVDDRDGHVGIQIQNKNQYPGSMSGITFYDPNGTRKCFMGVRHDGTPEVAIGAVNVPTGYVMAVDGKMVAEEVKVMNLPTFPDYVFEEGYNLMPLEELEQTLVQTKHLPGIPAASEVAQNGVSIGEMQTKLLQKIEELTLYVIELKKENVQMKNRVASLEK